MGREIILGKNWMSKSIKWRVNLVYKEWHMKEIIELLSVLECSMLAFKKYLFINSLGSGGSLWRAVLWENESLAMETIEYSNSKTIKIFLAGYNDMVYHNDNIRSEKQEMLQQIQKNRN